MFRRFAISSSLLLLATGCVFDDVNKEPQASPVDLGKFDGKTNVTITTADILKGASDPDGDTVSVTGLALARGLGQLEQNGDSWTYRVSSADTGNVQFNYIVSDGTLNASSTASFTIDNPNRLIIRETNPISLTMNLTGDGLPLNTLKATLSILGEEHSVTSTDGEVGFIGLPANTEYFVKFEDTSGTLATEYLSNITPTASQRVVQTLPVSNLTKPVTTELTATNVLNNSAVLGLKPYMSLNEIAAQNGRLISTQLPKLEATATDSGYQFTTANNEQTYTVFVEELIDSNGSEYNVFNTSNTQYQGRVKSGDTLELNLTPVVAAQEFNVEITTLDEQNQAVSLGKFLNVYNVDKDQVELWQVIDDSENSNQYRFTLSADNLKDTRVIQAVDNNQDGFADLQPVLNQAHPLGLINQLSAADFSDNQAMQLTIKVAAPATAGAITAELIDSASELQTGSVGQVLIAFDRPVELPDFVTLKRVTLSSRTQSLALNNPAFIYQQNRTTRVSTDKGQSSLTLDSINRYTYTNNNDQTASVNISNTGSVNSPYVTALEQNSSDSILAQNQFSLKAAGTLLVITPQPTSLIANNQYQFEFETNSAVSNDISASFNFSQFVRSSAVETLADFTLDNFNSKDTTQYTTSSEPTLSNQEAHQDLFTELNVGYNNNQANALLKYLDYSTLGFETFASIMSEINISSDNNTLYLITKTPVDGKINLLKQTETYLSGGESVTTETDLNGPEIELTLTAGGNNKAVGQKVFIFNRALNHGIDRKVITNAYKAEPITGANIADTGIYYVYPIAVQPQFNGQITHVEIQFDVSVNGAKRTGSETYQVK